MKSPFLGILFAAVAMAASPLAGLAQEAAPAVAAKERIGIYDSRSIAVAFAGTPAHEARLRRLRERHDAAKAAGDAAGAAKVEAEARALQRQAHRQAFGTAPVDDILAELGEAVAKVQRGAGVSALVSQWDETELQKHPEAERVDVTLPLIDAIHPTERQRRSALEIRKHKPLAPEQAAKLED